MNETAKASAPIRVLVVDDEPPARDRILTLLRRHPEVVAVGEAGHVNEAMELCHQLQPDALFLDIEMGCLTGFNLLERLPQPSPDVVFITAYEAFGTRAFSVDAVDYLLKPVDPERFAQAIRKLVRSQRLRQDELRVPVDRGIAAVALSEITHIEADGNYTVVHRNVGPSLHVRRGIVQWEEMLPADRFIRVHRSLIVNRQRVRTLRSRTREEGELSLEGVSEPVTLKRRALQRLRQLFSHEVTGE